MEGQTITTAGLAELRARRDRLTAAAAAVARVGHQAPVELVDELQAIPAVVDVEISCLLCRGPGTYRTEVASDATPRAGICSQCDPECSVELWSRS